MIKQKTFPGSTEICNEQERVENLWFSAKKLPFSNIYYVYRSLENLIYQLFCYELIYLQYFN
jgi:hypothetical protein